jgi:hypothetical protein
MHRPQVFLGGEVEPPRDALEITIRYAFDSAPQAKGSNCEILHAGVLHELGDSGVLHQGEQSLLEATHPLALATR